MRSAHFYWACALGRWVYTDPRIGPLPFALLAHWTSGIQPRHIGRGSLAYWVAGGRPPGTWHAGPQRPQALAYWAAAGGENFAHWGGGGGGLRTRAWHTGAWRTVRSRLCTLGPSSGGMLAHWAVRLWLPRTGPAAGGENFAHWGGGGGELRTGAVGPKAPAHWGGGAEGPCALGTVLRTPPWCL